MSWPFENIIYLDVDTLPKIFHNPFHVHFECSANMNKCTLALIDLSKVVLFEHSSFPVIQIVGNIGIFTDCMGR